MRKKIKLIALSFWTLFVFFLIVAQLPEHHGTIEKMNDKIAHFFLMGIFSGLLAFNLTETKLKKSMIFLISYTAGIFYSGLGEIIQLYVPGRDTSELDFLAGVIGSLFFSGIFYLIIKLQNTKPKLLLHICCVGCGVYVSQVLKKEYNVVLYYFNPNIFPKDEYDKRLEEARKISRKFNLKLITGKYDHKKWLEEVKGHEQDPEKGERCLICYRKRLEETSRMAKNKNFQYFTTTLTTSPHKLATEISRIGKELEKENGLKFLDKDFKKQDGFKKSSQLSRDLKLYRQDYCGCEFSVRR